MAILVAIGASGLGRRYTLSAGMTFGRVHTCDIQLIDPEVSKTHARIVSLEQGLGIEDLGSRNGVQVGGVRITGPTQLLPNLVVKIGTSRFLVDPDVEILPADPGQAVVLLDLARTQSSAPKRTTPTALPNPWFDKLLSLGLAANSFSEALGRCMTALRPQVAHDAAVLLSADTRETLWMTFNCRSFALGKSHVEMALEGEGVLVIDKDTSDVEWTSSGTSHTGKHRTLALVVLCLEERTVGLLALARPADRPFSKQEIALLQMCSVALAAVVVATRQLEAASVARAGLARSELLGASISMQNVREQIARAAPTPSTVLLWGETGTGKEVAARLLHEQSLVHTGPFVAINCGAIAEGLVESELFGHERGAFSGAERQVPGKLEMAHDGTLFLDEIAELPPAMQVKLLRALEERSFYRVGGTKPVRVNVRLVAASHKNLTQAVADGTFRQDLFYRLNVIQLVLPPLCERGDDVLLLTQEMMRRFAGELGRPMPTLSESARAALLAYAWPGNVRELRNVIERTLVLCHAALIEAQDLPQDLVASPKTSHDILDAVAAE